MYVHAVLTTPLLRSNCVLIRPRPHYVFFEHVQSSTTSFTSMKTLLRSYRFLLRSYYVLQVLTASIQFFKDADSVKRVLAVNQGFVHIPALATDNNLLNQWQEEKDRRNYFMFNLYKSLGPDRDRTHDLWLCSQTHYKQC